LRLSCGQRGGQATAEVARIPGVRAKSISYLQKLPRPKSRWGCSVGRGCQEKKWRSSAVVGLLLERGACRSTVQKLLAAAAEGVPA
jgi:hypothetical protein